MTTEQLEEREMTTENRLTMRCLDCEAEEQRVPTDRWPADHAFQPANKEWVSECANGHLFMHPSAETEERVAEENERLLAARTARRRASRFPPPPEDPGYDPTAHYHASMAEGIDY